MRPIEPRTEAAAALERLLPLDLPARQRCLGVLDGTLAGAIRADDADPPGWMTVTELADGTTYVGGDVAPPQLAAIFATLEPVSGEFVIGLTGPGDPVRAMLPARGVRWSRAIDFTDRVPPPDEEARLEPPAGCVVVAMDPSLLARTAW